MKGTFNTLTVIALALGTISLNFASAITLQDALTSGLQDLSTNEASLSNAAKPAQEAVALTESQISPQEAELRELYQKAKSLRELEKRETEALAISEVYLDLLHLHYRLSAAQRQVALHEEALKANQNSDESAPIEERLELAKADLRKQIEELEALRPKFIATVGVEPGQLEIPPAVTSLQQAVIQIDTTKNFTYQAAIQEASAHELEVEVAKALWSPHLNVEAQGDNAGAAPTSASTENLPSISEAMSRAEASLALSLEARSNADATVSKALEHYGQISAQLQQRAAASDELVQLALQIEHDHRAGNRSILELLEVRNAQFRAETEFAESHIQQRRHAFRLLAATGELTSHIGFSEKPIVPTPVQVIASAPAEQEAPDSIFQSAQANRSQLMQGEIVAIVEPAGDVKEVFSIGVPETQGGDQAQESPYLGVGTERNGVRRLGSQIVAMVEPAMSPPTDLLPVSRDVTRRKREPVKEEAEKPRPFQKMMKLFKREKWRKSSEPE